MDLQPAKIRADNWVTKTEFMNFIRCPYFFWLEDSGQIPKYEFLTQQQLARIEHGIQVHEQITSAAKPLILGFDDLIRVAREQSIEVLDVPIFENQELELRGCPDGIVTGCGALLPIEIKTRKDSKSADKLELAFYWLLLEPFRTKKENPAGYLRLHGLGEAREVRIEITDQLIAEVHERLKELRRVRKEGTRPSYHNCPYCNGENREASLKSSHQNKDLSLIRGIGPVTLRLLESIGIRNYDELGAVDKYDLLDRIRASGAKASLYQIDGWQNHVKSYQTNRPVVFGSLPTISDTFLALDLEYLPQSRIWLIGLAKVLEGNTSYTLLWSVDEAEELVNLKLFSQIILEYKHMPIISWNGKAADMPQLKAALSRHASQLIDMREIEANHIDLFQVVAKSVRLPQPEHGLHEVAKYFKLRQSSDVSNGLQASDMFIQYCNATDETLRQHIKDKLLEYSRCDLEALVGITNHVRLLSAAS